MRQAPIEIHMQQYRTINRILGDGADPLECAAAVALTLQDDIRSFGGQVEIGDPPPANVPGVLQRMYDDKAWLRFFPVRDGDEQRWVTDLKQRYRAAHGLFRAVAVANDAEAQFVLFQCGAQVIREVLELEERR